MRTITKTMSVLAVSAFLAVSNPTMAQTASDNTSTTTTRSNDNDDSGKWGLLGLAGLLGLFGLRKKDDHRHINTGVNR